MRIIKLILFLAFILSFYSCKPYFVLPSNGDDIIDSVRLTNYSAFIRIDTLFNDNYTLTTGITEGKEVLARHYMLIENGSDFPKRVFHVTPFPFFHRKKRDPFRNGISTQYGLAHFANPDIVDFRYLLEIHEGRLTEDGKINFTQLDLEKSTEWTVEFSNQEKTLNHTKIKSPHFSDKKKRNQRLNDPVELSLDTILYKIPQYVKSPAPMFILSDYKLQQHPKWREVDVLYIGKLKPCKKLRHAYFRFNEGGINKYAKFKYRFQRFVK